MIAVIVAVVATNIVAAEGSESVFGQSYAFFVDSNMIFNVFQKGTVVFVNGSIALLLVLILSVVVAIEWHSLYRITMALIVCSITACRMRRRKRSNCKWIAN